LIKRSPSEGFAYNLPEGENISIEEIYIFLTDFFREEREKPLSFSKEKGSRIVLLLS